MSNVILCAKNEEGLKFEVRSSRAMDRRETAKKNIDSTGEPLDSATYSFRNWEPSVVKVFNEGQGEAIETNIRVEESICSTKVESSISNKKQQRRGVEPALFFDQTPYTFEITLPEGTQTARIISPISEWSDVADWSKKNRTILLQTNFNNDLGEFELAWSWETEDGEYHYASFIGEVYSTKLDIFSDFKVMIDEVKDRFDFIRLDLLRKTRWGWSTDQDVDSDIPTWVIIFQDVRETMESNFNKLIQEHRKKLTSEIHYVRADRLRKVSPKLEERVAEGIKDNFGKRYRYEKRILTPDTPENRYMKYLLFHTVDQLLEAIETLKCDARIAKEFIKSLEQWVEQWNILKQNNFWRGIGSFRGLKSESLILSQDPIYATLRRSWILLQHGLSFMGDEQKGGIQNVAQLYEVWCLIKILEIVESNKDWIPQRETTTFFDLSIEENQEGDPSERDTLTSKAAKFQYNYMDNEGIQLSILFQPIANHDSNKNSDLWEGVWSTPTVQQPDIVVRLHRNDLYDSPAYTWIFDAKYRITNNQAPEDALYQMHRYRDSILWMSGNKTPSRESIGAFVLYPGKENGHSKITDESKQIASIKKVNIGAYPLKPGKDATHSLLEEALTKLIEVKQDFHGVEDKKTEYFSTVPTVRFPKTAIFAKCVTRTGDKMNTKPYWDKCRYYRLPVSKLDAEQVKTFNFIIPTDGKNNQLANLPVLSVEIKKRFEIVDLYKIAGIEISSKVKAEQKEYYLFTLGEPLSDMPTLGEISSKQLVSIVEV